MENLHKQVLALEEENSRLKQEVGKSRKTAAHYFKLIEKATDILYETDMNGHFIFVNPVSSKVTGYSEKELLGLHFLELIRDDCRKEASLFYGRQFSDQKSDTYFEFPIRTKDGREVWLGQNVQPIIRAGAVVGFQAVARDITKAKQAEEGLKKYQEQLELLVESRTFELRKKNCLLEQEVAERKQAQTALLESEEKYRSIIENMEEGYYEVDLAGTFTFSNQAFATIFGLARDQLTGVNYTTFVDEAMAGRVYRTFNQVYTSGLPTKAFDIDVQRNDGSERCIEFNVSLKKGFNEEPVGFRGLAWDVTEKKRLELDLRESEEQHRMVVEFSNDAIFEVQDQHFVLVNPKALVIFGYGQKEELLGKHFLTVIHPDDRDRMLDIYLRRHRGEPAPSNYEFTGLRKDGSPVPIEISSTKAIHHGRSSSFAFLRDVTERKQAEETLLRTYAKMTRLINSISSILIAVSEDDRVVFWNTTAEREFGLQELQIVGKPLEELGIPWEWDRIEEGICRCRQENAPLGLDNVKFIQSSGKDGVLGLRFTPLIGEEFLGTGILIQGANISKRKILENQLTQAQKLESIGQLAAGIAHEINTPTQYVGDNVRFLKTSFEEIVKVLMKYHDLKEGMGNGKVPGALLRELEDLIESTDLEYLSEEIPRAIQQTLEGVNRISRIVGSMKDFAHPGKEEKVYADINKAIENTILVARNEWKYVAELITELDPSLPPVCCIPGDINQVLLNILVNAAQAIGEVVGDGSEGKGEISIGTRRVDDSLVEIRIRDSGKGIPEGIREKVFDPFFTTKEVGKGTGQGLAISYKAIVERHAGSLTFETEAGQGTAFIIRLPVEDATNAGKKET